MTDEDTFDSLKYHIEKDECGTYYFDQNGEYHREDDLPAIVQADGGKMWYNHGICERGGGMPCMVSASGHSYWFEHGQFVKRTYPGPDGIMRETTVL